jgi:hypothetical protein
LIEVPPLARRHVLACLTGSLLLSRTGRARAASAAAAPAPVPAVPFPSGVTVLVGGPDGGTLSRWGEVISSSLGDALPQGTAFHIVCAGGTDGVTGANQFEARVPPDGTTVLLTPGAAALDWLVGDPRAHFDAGHWVPVMAGVTPAVLMARREVLPLSKGRAVRLAGSGPAGPQLPALLAFDLLGVPMQPVFGVVEHEAAIAAFAAGTVDAVLAFGANVPQQVATLEAAGGKPLFSLGATGAGGAVGRDEMFGEVPTFGELYTSFTGDTPAGPRYDAYRATAAATQLEFGLVLPQLTSAAMVALWRRAAEQAAAGPGVQNLAANLIVQPLNGVAAAAATTSVAPDTAALLELRGWLATRLNWRPA